MGKADRLTSQLTYLPHIIGAMGVNIAEAQQRLNSDYVATLHGLVDVLEKMVKWAGAGGDEEKITLLRDAQVAVEAAEKAFNEADEADKQARKDDLDAAKNALATRLGDVTGEEHNPGGYDSIRLLLEAVAPSRYQFTETTLDFSADLSESLQVAGDVSLGAGFSGVAISAGASVAFGYDYRAAARITTKLHAIHPNATTAERLLKRAEAIDGSQKGTLPKAKEVDLESLKMTAELFNTLTGAKLAIPEQDA